MPNANAFEKDPDAVLEWQYNWHNWLPSGDSIASATVTVSDGITIDSQTNTSTAVTVWLSGGSEGTTYYLTCHIVTSMGRVDDRTISIFVVER